MRRPIASAILIAAALGASAARHAMPPPELEPGTPIDGGCRAVALRTGDSGPATVLLVRSDDERFQVVLPFAADWQLTCVPDRRVASGSDRLLSGETDKSRLFASVLSSRGPGEFDERAHLTDILENLRVTMHDQGLTLDQDAITAVRDHLTLEYRIVGRIGAGIEGTEYEVWSTRLRQDGVAIDTHLSWDASGLALEPHDLDAARAALRGAVAMSQILPPPPPRTRRHPKRTPRPPVVDPVAAEPQTE